MPAHNPHDPLDDELTSAQAAALLGVSTRTLERLKAAGRIGYVRVGDRTLRYTRRQVEDYLGRVRETVEAS